jgi:hypothetical protein
MDRINTKAPTVQVGQVGRNVEFVCNSAIETCIDKLQIHHDLPIKVLGTVNSSFVKEIPNLIRHGSGAYEPPAACTCRTWPVRPPLPFADLPAGRP